jgi:hypothetical protein
MFRNVQHPAEYPAHPPKGFCPTNDTCDIGRMTLSNFGISPGVRRLSRNMQPLYDHFPSWSKANSCPHEKEDHTYMYMHWDQEAETVHFVSTDLLHHHEKGKQSRPHKELNGILKKVYGPILPLLSHKKLTPVIQASPGTFRYVLSTSLALDVTQRSTKYQKQQMRVALWLKQQASALHN